MTQPKNDKAPEKGGKSSASSLTDAVVAALAQVEARDSKRPKVDGAKVDGSEAKPAEPATTEQPAPAKVAEAAAARPAVVVTEKAEVAVGEPTAEPAVAKAEPAVAKAEPAAAEAEPAKPSATPTEPETPAVREAATAPSEATTEGGREGSPTRPHPMVAVEQVVRREGPVPEGLGARYFGRTDVGLVREHNEDNFLVADLSAKRRGIETAILETKVGARGCVFAVCDGMGGAAAGEVASQMAIDTIFEVMDEGGEPTDRDDFARRLVRAVEEAGGRIFSAAKMDRTRRGMGTTATVAGLIDSTLFVGQVGDSRAYVLRDNQFALITKDQSLVNQLIEAGQLTEEEAEAFEHSNIILQALGTTEEVTVDLTFLELRRGDRLLLCSDGLSGLVHADMMREVLAGSPSLAEAAAQLISMANSGGGHDNITVVLVEFDGTTLKESAPDARVTYQQYPLPPAPEPAPKVPSRAPQMKAGGPKPGADVKKAAAATPRAVPVRPRENNDTGGSPLIWIGVTVLLILVLVAIAWAITGGSGGEAEDRGRSRGAAPARPREEPVAEGTLEVSTDVLDAELWINGTRHGALVDGMRLPLAPGAYHLEARSGEIDIAETTVTIASSEMRRVILDMPTIEPEELSPPTVEVDRAELHGEDEAPEGEAPEAAPPTEPAEARPGGAPPAATSGTAGGPEAPAPSGGPSPPE